MAGPHDGAAKDEQRSDHEGPVPERAEPDDEAKERRSLQVVRLETRAQIVTPVCHSPPDE